MSNGPEPGKHLDTVILLLALALFLFASPLVTWWSDAGSSWYLPYLLWAIVILLTVWLQYRRGRP